MVALSRCRSTCLALLIGTVACTSAWADSRLSQKDAIHIANRKAQQILHYDLREYEIYFARYFADEDKWVINYRGRKHPEGHNWFSVEIKDRTREATVWLP